MCLVSSPPSLFFLFCFIVYFIRGPLLFSNGLLVLFIYLFYFIIFHALIDAGEVVFKESEQSLEFVDAINALTAHRGGDCAEYTLAGIVNAFGQDPLFGSPMYVFTDAGPKDATEEKIEEVKILAEMDDVTIHFLTTGIRTSCSLFINYGECNVAGAWVGDGGGVSEPPIGSRFILKKRGNGV